MVDSQISTLYDELEEKLTSEQYEEARTVLENIADIYQSSDHIQVAQALAVWPTDSAAVEQKRSLTGLTRQTLQTQGLRGRFLASAVLFLNNPDQRDIDEVLSQLSSVRDAESIQEETEEDVTSILGSVEIPANVEITGIGGGQTVTSIEVGTENTLSVTGRNVGDRAATDVRLTVTTPGEEQSSSPTIPDALTISSNPVSVGQVSGGESFAHEFSISASHPGEYSLLIRVTSSEMTDSSSHLVSVEPDDSPPAVGDFENPPTDPDGDGRYEDINGDGTFDIVDVQALFANLDSDAVQNNPEAFDFNGDGQVDVVDVQALFAELNTEE